MLDNLSTVLPPAGRACALLFLLAWPTPAQTPGAETARNSVRIAFAGDVLMEASWRQPPLPPRELFKGAQDRLAAADLTVVNLESPLTQWPEKTRHKSPRSVARGLDYILRVTSTEAAAALREAGVDFAALANNHTMDYTERGLLDTLEQLRAAGVVAVGGGANRAEAEAVRVIEVQGLRVGVLSFSDVLPPGFAATETQPGIASAKDVTRLREAVRAARAQTDLLLVVFHWGRERMRHPTPRQKELAQAAAQAGAHAIFGAHPHVLQGIGCVNSKGRGSIPVVYSGGNFVFPTSRPGSQRSAIFELEAAFPPTRPESNQDARAALSIRVIPTMMNEEGRARVAEPALARDILRDVQQASQGLGARFAGDTARCLSAAPKP